MTISGALYSMFDAHICLIGVPPSVLMLDGRQPLIGVLPPVLNYSLLSLLVTLLCLIGSRPVWGWGALGRVLAIAAREPPLYFLLKTYFW